MKRSDQQAPPEDCHWLLSSEDQAVLSRILAEIDEHKRAIVTLEKFYNKEVGGVQRRLRVPDGLPILLDRTDKRWKLVDARHLGKKKD